ncbi:MAG: SMR family transporter [Armatimonadota bacterium]
MPFSAVVLVVLSCALHAFWNLLLKQAKNKFAFTALFLGITPLIFVPMLSLVLIHTPSLLGWICIFATGIVYAAYFAGLAQAYLVSDLSFAYPLSRGLGPALTVIWGMVFLSERPSAVGFIGIALVLVGAFALQWQPRTPFYPRFLFASHTLPAWFVGVIYSIYSIIDKFAVGYVRVHPAVYIYATYSVCAAIVFPFALRLCGKEALRKEWQRNWKLCIATGILNIAAYLLVLWAMSLPNTPASYIIPLRTLSVLFGVLFGTEILGESGRWKKLGAAVLLMTGVSLIAIA